MKPEQLSIFLENRSGRLAEITGVLARAGINIRALSLADTADFGILRLIVNEPARAAETLRGNGFTVATNEMVALEVPDRPGGLWEILTAVGEAALNVEYMYAFVRRSHENAVVMFRFDEPDRAIAVLQKAGVQVLSGKEVYAL